MVQAHHCRKLAVQVLPLTRHLDLPFLPHNHNKVVMVATQPISNKDMVFTVVKQAVNMVV